jgi:hypothetical protein
VIIMQRLHEGDVSGDILAREADYSRPQRPSRQYHPNRAHNPRQLGLPNTSCA